MALIPGAVLAADRAHVLAAMANFKLRRGTLWLGAAHPAAHGQFPSGGWADVSLLPDSDLIQATAVAAPNHCLDGWSYASRATNALLSGDFHACRHLAYYAQLRAGLSILANLGVGLFNRINFVVTATGTTARIDAPGSAPKLLGLGTHDAVWRALKAWSSDSGSARLLLELIKIKGVSLRDCLDAIWPGSSSTAIAGTLLRSWGLDLARGRGEHDFRNISSYNAQSLNPLSTTLDASLTLVGQFWELCEPSGSGGFFGLDRYLVRNVLWAQHRKVKQNTNYASGAIGSSYGNLSPLITAFVSKEFLTGVVDGDDPPLIKFAQATTSPAEPVEMLARSYLLLRAATALTYNSFVDAGLSPSSGDLRPWIDELAASRGFWSPTAPLHDPTELWEDIQLAMMDYDAARDPMPPSWYDWMAQSDRGIPHVSELERVGVWSLGA